MRSIVSSRKVSGDAGLSIYEFKIGQLAPKVKVMIYPDRERGKGFAYVQSHFISTPTQMNSYKTSRPWGDTEDYALSLITRGFAHHYNEAVAAGFLPEDSWLESNPNF